MKLLSSIVVVTATLLIPPSATAATITFGTANVDLLQNAGVRTEAGFNYQAFGDGWELENFVAVSGAALVTFFAVEGSDANDRVEFTQVGGGTFTFSTMQFRTATSANSDDVRVDGFLSGALQASAAITGSLTSFGSFTPAAFVGVPLDLLRITVTAGSPSVNTSAMFFDNVVLTSLDSAAVPEPTTLSLLGLGLAGVVARRRMKRR